MSKYVVTYVLVQQELIDALKGTILDKTTNEDWKVMGWKVVSISRLCLSDQVNYSMINTIEIME